MGTPLLIASIPVRAAQPEENALRIIKIKAASVRAGKAPATGAATSTSCPEKPTVKYLITPTMTRARMAKMKA